MPTPMRSNQVHISGMDARAARLAKEYHCGYEITAFSYAPMLADAAAFSRVEAECAGLGSLWLHAPFAELIPCAIDPNVRANAMVRFRQTAALAARLGVRRIVVHGGFIPYVYFPEWYVEQSVNFWKEFLSDAPDDLLLAVENVMEPGPELLVEIARGVDDPRLGLCLDVGHANTVVSKTPPADWLAPMLPDLRHVHLHDNHGALDEHLPLGTGTIDFAPILTVLAAHPEITITLENQDVLPSLQYLRADGWLPALL